MKTVKTREYILKEITVVTGWLIDGRPSGYFEIDGHIPFDEALSLSSDIIQTTDGAYVEVYHDVRGIGLQTFSGNYDGGKAFNTKNREYGKDNN